MKSKIIISSILVFLLLVILACNEKSTEPDDNLTAKPIIKKSSLNYDDEIFRKSCPDTSSLNNINKAYSNNFSEEIRNELIAYIKSEITKLGEDVNIFDEILTYTGCKNTDEYLIPFYAERAKYENKEVWIFQLTYGLGKPEFGHNKCFAFSLETLDTLAFISCR